MTILVDIDGVIFNTQETLLSWLNEFEDANYTMDDITSYDWFDKTFEDPWEPMTHESFWRCVKANHQAIDYILKWKHKGHTIKFVTASYYHNNLPFKIHKLLDYFNGEFDDKDVIICHDKSMVLGSVLIDDCFDNVKNFPRLFSRDAILYAQPWNIRQYYEEDSCNIVCCDNWSKIDTHIQFLSKYL